MFEPVYEFVIIKKDESVLALPTGMYRGISAELNALYSQGYIFCCEIIAPSPAKAVEEYNREIDKLNREIVRLNRELSRLQAAYGELQWQNENLKSNSSWSHEASGSVKYYELFGFSEFPQQEELKKRFRLIRQKLHPDKGGDKQLFQLFEQAYGALTKA